MRALFILTILVGSTLLFLVQPMTAKRLLPLLGGTSSVWNTCLLFFQVMLLLGYLWAHLVTRLARPRVDGRTAQGMGS